MLTEKSYLLEANTLRARLIDSCYRAVVKWQSKWLNPQICSIKQVLFFFFQVKNRLRKLKRTQHDGGACNLSPWVAEAAEC